MALYAVVASVVGFAVLRDCVNLSYGDDGDGDAGPPSANEVGRASERPRLALAVKMAVALLVRAIAGAVMFGIVQFYGGSAIISGGCCAGVVVFFPVCFDVVRFLLVHVVTTAGKRRKMSHLHNELHGRRFDFQIALNDIGGFLLKSGQSGGSSFLHVAQAKDIFRYLDNIAEREGPGPNKAKLVRLTTLLRSEDTYLDLLDEPNGGMALDRPQVASALLLALMVIFYTIAATHPISHPLATALKFSIDNVTAVATTFDMASFSLLTWHLHDYLEVLRLSNIEKKSRFLKSKDYCLAALAQQCGVLLEQRA